MRKNAFTLIELLAVIVILAIIALIAVPIVIHIIDDSKKSSEEESLKLYQDAVQKAITKKQMSDPDFNPDKCSIKDNGDIKCYKGKESLQSLKIEIKGTFPTKGLITVQDNKFNYTNIYLNNKYYYEKGILVEKNGTEEINIGDKYTYKVNDTDTFNFYVLSFNDDNTVNLIMDRNICNDGTVNYTKTNNYCRYKWYISETSDNRYGPVTAMTELYDGTKEWNNVPDMIMNYTDENNQDSIEYGYTGIITSNGTATIIGKPATNVTTVGTNLKPLKARLPKQSEVMGAGCTTSGGSCPTWLMENMKYYNVSNDKYSMNNNNENYQIFHGYWLLSSYPNQYQHAYFLYYTGKLSHGYSRYYEGGLRPVITVPIDYLAN